MVGKKPGAGHQKPGLRGLRKPVRFFREDFDLVLHACGCEQVSQFVRFRNGHQRIAAAVQHKHRRRLRAQAAFPARRHATRKLDNGVELPAFAACGDGQVTA